MTAASSSCSAILSVNFFKFYMAAELGPLGVDQLRVIWRRSSFLYKMAKKSDPFEGLTFSGAPAEYRHFRRKVLLHVASLEEKHARLAGPKIFTRLTGEAWSATEHLSIADLRTEDGWLTSTGGSPLYIKANSLLMVMSLFTIIMFFMLQGFA